MMSMGKDSIQEETLQKFIESGRRLAAQAMAKGDRKGLSADGQEVTITITLPGADEGASENSDEPPVEGPIKKKMREMGMAVE